MLESLHQRDVFMQDPYFAVKIQQFLYICSRKYQIFVSLYTILTLKDIL